MGVIGFVLLCVVVGLVTWVAVTYVPMPGPFQKALPIIALALLVLLLLVIVLGGVHDVPIPRLR